MPFKSFVLPLHPTITFTSPSQLAKWDIAALSDDQSLIQIRSLGGPPDQATVEENERRAREYQRRFLEIIKKYGVEEEYLTPLLEEQKRLWTELIKISKEIEAIRA